MLRIRTTREDRIRAGAAIALLATLYLARAHAQELSPLGRKFKALGRGQD